MPEQNVIVWDLETVPDLRAAVRMLNMDGAPDDEVRAAVGPGFPKHPLHKIGCIGALVAEVTRTAADQVAGSIAAAMNQAA